MATRNSRNARLLLCATLGGTYVAVSKTHGLKLNVPTDFSEDTSHGDRFKSKIPGLQDFEAKLMAWYDTVYPTLKAMSYGKISEYFLAYFDFADTLNYIRGQMYLGLDEIDLDLGNTVGESYTGVIANADVQFILQGAALT